MAAAGVFTITLSSAVAAPQEFSTVSEIVFVPPVVIVVVGAICVDKEGLPSGNIQL